VMARTDPVFTRIDEWYERAPALSAEEVNGWVQDNADIPCPKCGQYLWIIRGENARDRGRYHLAMCENPECDFQAAD
jgi:predicted RNA-binding Zn-ribbon protein involved in translation (DUF1610 family)